MDKNTRLALTAASLVLLACPGMCLCLFGPTVSEGRLVFQGVNYADLAGWLMVCTGLALTLSPLLVFWLTKRWAITLPTLKKKLPPDWDEPLPPPI
jgi:hypothetical protein